jgi:hypothetical protein
VPARGPAHRRRAVLYVVVISMSLLVALIGLSGVLTARIQTRLLAQSNDWTEAGVLAQSAADYALTILANTSNWRKTFTSGTELGGVTLGRGTIAGTLVDETDGDLANNPGHSIRVYGLGRVGEAVRVFSAKAAGQDPLTCLNAAMTVNSNLSFATTKVVASGQTVACNANVSANTSANIKANVEAVGSISGPGGAYKGTCTTNVDVRGLPDNDVFEYYVANGTSISIGAIPLNASSQHAIRNALLSPTSNPYTGTCNAQGIYVIDCQNQTLCIYGCRIVGTLVVLNPGANSGVGGTNGSPVNWVPAVSGLPCLLVGGAFTLSFDSASPGVEETKAGNLNPTGTPYPYPGGTSNLTALDTYPSVIAGLVYVSGTVTGGNYSPAINMLMVGGAYNGSNDTLTLSYDATYFTSPPPGFRGMGQMAPVPGTWRWEAAP